ncbi:coiled-coil domain-containing protein [Faecalibacter macacae]|uniref:Cell envelope biogenesis protein OmpA n=1 Tax=Faecalibacter macacae TaxID=1859289 RepID=A0A3L9MFU7_9FLAO|nr:hypothetical protein [Faecalibacter macacae]RLZ11920.1 hypothetical protein EAH69_03075 [Faecalibacter macacae]
MKKIIFSCIILAGITSCVPQKKFDDLENSYYTSLDEQGKLNKELTLANHTIETLQKDLDKTKKELYVKDTALDNAQKLMKISQSEFEGLLQEMHSALNSSSNKSQTFFNQLTDKEKQVEDLLKSQKDLEAKIEAQNNEILNLKKQIFVKEIQDQVK